jgi:hypothetical protein
MIHQQNHEDAIHVFINQERHEFSSPEQTGRAVKERAHVPLDHILCMEVEPHHHHHQERCECERKDPGAELRVIDDDQDVILQNGQHFWTHPAATRGVVVTINRKEYEFTDLHQSGRSLKERAGIPLADVLFLDRPHEDEVITDDTKITLKMGECFHSAPPANYGHQLDVAAVGVERFTAHSQPDGWTFLVIPEYAVPDAFSPGLVQLLVKLPPTFPDAAPDMFWVNPQVRTPAGAPQGTSIESLLGGQWQRFSWHLLPGAWQPGTSTLRDFMRCIRARFEKRN